METTPPPTPSTAYHEDDDAASDASEDPFPTIAELMSSPDTAKRRAGYQNTAAPSASPSETVRARLVAVDANKRALPLNLKPAPNRELSNSASIPQRSNSNATVNTQSSWLREERPASGRAALPVMDPPSRPSPAAELQNPRASKRSTDAMFTMKASRKKIVKLRVNPRSLHQMHVTRQNAPL